MRKLVASYVRLPENLVDRLRKYAEVHLAYLEDIQHILDKINVVIGYDVPCEHLKRMERLEMFQSYAAGVDGLPWDCIPGNVIVCSNAGANADAVAEHAWALVLALAKNLHIHFERASRGEYVQSPGSLFLKGRVLGVIGLGSIGLRVAEIGKAFGMKVYGVSRSGVHKPPCDFVGGPGSLDKVLEESDVIVLAAPLTRETRGMIDLRRLRKLKRDAIMVNVGRAELVKREDLLQYLEENPGFRFASDVWWNIKEDFRREAEILRYPNVVATPWIAGGFGNREVWEGMLEKAVENVVEYLRRGRPRNVVNRSDYV